MKLSFSEDVDHLIECIYFGGKLNVCKGKRKVIVIFFGNVTHYIN